MSTRTEIRRAIKATLEATGLFKTVKVGRRRKFSSSQLPACCLYVEDEQKERYQSGDTILLRSVVVAREIIIAGSDPEQLEEELDALEDQTEKALFESGALIALAEDYLPGGSRYDVEEEGQSTTAIAVVRDAVEYLA